ncbi:iron-sulfur cluster insertion protein ErpA [Candidatus Tremblaya phenacola]|uniref:Iron-sulfur cluster insertion protein ErpA n=1 Tax=Candidatus Tremblayella phenacoccinincola TaxID=1010676 RepID=A0A2G0V772_9PROT|nr:iron-sulfur cluster insertion protein ErpA [Candidatus Tremblaya phenacola]PHN16320.1 Iron-sulfur cluster insertion protein ErpA [Candidatus Tremblaya phenacola]
MLTFTDNSTKHMCQVIQEKSNPNLKLRVFVLGGGCAGLQYMFALVEKQCGDDLAFVKRTVSFIVDCISLQYLNNAVIDYRSSIDGSYYIVYTPSTASTCHCGSSFVM